MNIQGVEHLEDSVTLKRGGERKGACKVSQDAHAGHKLRRRLEEHSVVLRRKRTGKDRTGKARKG